VIDEALPLELAVPRADVVYLSQTISRILETLASIDPLLSAGALVTDAGSTKVTIVDQARHTIRRGQFLGGHPMAGKEKRGVQYAEADLFVGRTYVLTPSETKELESPAARNFLQWIRRIGAVPVILDPTQHDRIVSYTSHLPQLASTALAAALAERLSPKEALQTAGPGLADTTRLALSAYEVWGDILATNTAEIEKALETYMAKLNALRAQLQDDQMRQQFEAAAEFARRLRKDTA
jgi:prephenate dehydrogenase